MKSLVFDTGPIISLVTNNLLWVLEELKKRYGGEFYISPAVKKEVVDKPLKTKRFKLGALQLMSFISQGTIKVYKPKNLKNFNFLVKKIFDIANTIYLCRDVNMKIVHRAEIESLTLAKILNADAFVVDERNTRLLVEEPNSLAQLLSRKLHTNIRVNNKPKKEFLKAVGHINLIRSVELMTVAYDFGILDLYAKGDSLLKSVNLKRTLLEGTLWGLKLHGCAISENEIKEVMKLRGF